MECTAVVLIPIKNTKEILTALKENSSCFINIFCLSVLFLLWMLCVSALNHSKLQLKKLCNHVYFDKSTSACASALNWLDSKMCGGENMNLLIASAQYNKKICYAFPRGYNIHSALKYVLEKIISPNQPQFSVIFHWSGKTKKDKQQKNQIVCLL